MDTSIVLLVEESRVSLTATKLTDAAALGVPSATVQYPTKPPLNSDNSLILILEVANFALYRVATGDRIGPLEWLGDNNNPLWSRTDKDVLYYTVGNEFRSYNVETRHHRNHRAFAEYSTISDKGEGDLGDGNHIALIGDNREVFLYEISTDTKGRGRDTGGRHLDSLYVTPDGDVIISWGIYGTERYTGVELFDSTMNFVRQLTRYVGHKDVTRDTDGSECMVITDNSTNAIMKVPLSGAAPTMILPPLDWAYAVHISCPSQSGFAIVSTYAAIHSGDLLKVPLDGSLATKLAYHGSVGLGYYDAPKAAVSYDGRWLAFNSNKDGRPNAYLLNLQSVQNDDFLPISSAPGVLVWKSFPNQSALTDATFPAQPGEAGFVYDGGDDVKLIHHDGVHKWFISMYQVQ